MDLIAHTRPRPGREPGASCFELGDHARLVQALSGVTTAMQLIGTIRKRFAEGDTYESSDIRTTEQLARAAREAGVDHLILLSSTGAGRPMGAYLQAKAKAERIVTESGIPFTIVRPSAFDGDRHHAPPGLAAVTKLLGLSRFRPIRVEQLAQTLLHVATTRSAVGEVLEGDTLWREVEAASRQS